MGQFRVDVDVGETDFSRDFLWRVCFARLADEVVQKPKMEVAWAGGIGVTVNGQFQQVGVCLGLGCLVP